MTKKKPKEEHKKRGVPSTYLANPEYFNNMVEGLGLLGLTEEEIARHLKVTPQCITNWKVQYPEFLLALKRGKEEADIKVAHSLYKRACGFYYRKEYYDKNDKMLKTHEEYVLPDVTAQIFWLKNRKADYWREKKEVAYTDMPAVKTDFKIQ